MEDFYSNRAAKNRITEDGFSYPLGAYPEKGFTPRTGYDSKYIREGAYFYYQVSLSHERILPVFIDLLRLLPESIYLVTQIHSDDYYNEYDTYVSETPVGREEFIAWLTEWSDVALDDGFFGVGAFVDSPPWEMFLDEHKTIHIYYDNPDLMEQTLENLGIPFVMELRFFWDEPHYHEPLTIGGELGENYLTAFENLADNYGLVLEEPPEEDMPDEDEKIHEMTCWKVEIRGYKPKSSMARRPIGFYSTLYLNAESREEAAELVRAYMESNDEYADLYLQMARVPEELITSDLRRRNPDPDEPCVWYESRRVEFEWGFTTE